MSKPNIDIERRKLRAMIVLLGVVVMTIGAFMYQSVQQGGWGEAVGGGVVAVIVLALLVPVLRSGHDNVRRGLPMKDERTRRIETKAAAWGFYVNLYALLALGMFGDALEVHTATGIAVLVSALVFLVSYMLLNRSDRV